jgi:acyl-coenzyme A thioesterase PaaI-like protein
MTEALTGKRGAENDLHVGLRFHMAGDGVVRGDFFADPKYEGYSGILHGGIVATVLDSAMTHCLLLKDIPALTGRLSVKYSRPIPTGSSVRLEATIVNQLHGVFILEGKALVNGKKVASAEAKYRTMKEGVHQGL